ncbi:hypothetical protein K443DRAFT_241733 [Laccaria amethystina LaAM-08-1]|uniref:Unplaced genomic scaffold K443scaffold_156, whole genome shotgun sequence n=1 Tax=Laccaria amethystina LaAM-08-1 TaxID=1095629 RepID=A0A0C9WLT1_9AGAR|nr:hypothetical protein K443DRAFT_241733 [Laccaria amethystina LaAM-08-1]
MLLALFGSFPSLNQQSTGNYPLRTSLKPQPPLQRQPASYQLPFYRLSSSTEVKYVLRAFRCRSV